MDLCLFSFLNYRPPKRVVRYVICCSTTKTNFPWENRKSPQTNFPCENRKSPRIHHEHTPKRRRSAIFELSNVQIFFSGFTLVTESPKRVTWSHYFLGRVQGFKNKFPECLWISFVRLNYSEMLFSMQFLPEMCVLWKSGSLFRFRIIS